VDYRRSGMHGDEFLVGPEGLARIKEIRGLWCPTALSAGQRIQRVI